MSELKSSIQKYRNAKRNKNDKEHTGGLLVWNKKPEFMYGNEEKIVFILSGISRNQLDAFKNTAGLNYDQLADMLAVSRATLFKRKEKEKYNRAMSERVFLLADLYSYGYAVFDNREHFKNWMKTENTALGNRKPIDLLETVYGIFEVKNIIGRIAYGVFS
ncbi:MAG: DUF2384 domain-containing protein [Chitinophagaceae bacterium]|jgi:putative toxin-antitoxin system antitoxin component (TIGR02293 family)|nr:DUF2384 domain-containing protein [Chitinophagaceae bacterium]